MLFSLVPERQQHVEAGDPVGGSRRRGGLIDREKRPRREDGRRNADSHARRFLRPLRTIASAGAVWRGAYRSVRQLSVLTRARRWSRPTWIARFRTWPRSGENAASAPAIALACTIAAAIVTLCGLMPFAPPWPRPRKTRSHSRRRDGRSGFACDSSFSFHESVSIPPPRTPISISKAIRVGVVIAVVWIGIHRTVVILRRFVLIRIRLVVRLRAVVVAAPGAPPIPLNGCDHSRIRSGRYLRRWRGAERVVGHAASRAHRK
jgi:hypothetical protein